MFRVGALILSDGRLLTVTNAQRDFYWTPGGKLEEGETPEAALSRELEEELGIEVVSSRLYHARTGTYIGLRDQKEFGYYLVEYAGALTPAHEVAETRWISKADHEANRYVLTQNIQEVLLPMLIADGLVN